MISAILLAAGTSSRMGNKNKLLLSWNGEPMIRHVARQLVAVPVDEILVVLGHEADKVKEALEGLPARFTTNHQFASGMTSSIQAGVAALSPQSEAFFVCLGDMPLLTSAHYAALIRFFEERKKTCAAPIVRPVNGDRKGHPVLFDAAYVPNILDCREQEGCREVIRNNQGRFFAFQVNDEAYYRDVDGKEDYLRAI
ncbi:MAG: nucleotidyltransferase family protein [Lewinellaceae bacterium]|nr:nucleotidyltransferase family protein [Lewinellaceae bacterium]